MGFIRDFSKSLIEAEDDLSDQIKSRKKAEEKFKEDLKKINSISEKNVASLENSVVVHDEVESKPRQHVVSHVQSPSHDSVSSKQINSEKKPSFNNSSHDKER